MNDVKLITVRIQATIIQLRTKKINKIYEQLQYVLGHSMRILMGYFNAQIGADMYGWEDGEERKIG